MFTTVNGLRDLLTPSVKRFALSLCCFGYFRVEMEWASPLEFIESHALPIPPWSDHTLNMHLSHEIYSQPETLPNLRRDFDWLTAFAVIQFLVHFGYIRLHAQSKSLRLARWRLVIGSSVVCLLLEDEAQTKEMQIQHLLHSRGPDVLLHSSISLLCSVSLFW